MGKVYSERDCRILVRKTVMSVIEDTDKLMANICVMAVIDSVGVEKAKEVYDLIIKYCKDYKQGDFKRADPQGYVSDHLKELAQYECKRRVKS